MARTKEVTVYKLEELTGSGRQTALDYVMKIRLQDSWYAFWYEPVIEDWEARLEEQGFLDAEIKFSGFGSQGDGASFTGRFNLKDAVKRFNFDSKIKVSEETFLEITRFDHNYVHENSCYIHRDICDFSFDTPFEDFAEFLEILEQNRLALCREIYRDLEIEYDALTSEENLIDCADEMDLEFYSDGTVA